MKIRRTLAKVNCSLTLRIVKPTETECVERLQRTRVVVGTTLEYSHSNSQCFPSYCHVSEMLHESFAFANDVVRIVEAKPGFKAFPYNMDAA